jgi:hypothetical protein
MENRTIWVVALAVLLTGGFFSLLGCEDEDRATLFAAQRCLDEIKMETGGTESLATYQSIKAQAEVCLARLGALSGQQAALVRCSAQSLRGGITARRFITAYAALAVEGARNEASYMIGLSVNTGSSVTENKSIAGEIFNSCVATEIDALIQMSSLIRLGTILASAGGSSCAPGDAGYPGCLSDSSTIADMVTNCAVATPPPDCDPAAVGETAQLLTSTYCSGANAATEACRKVSDAVTAGGSSSDIGVRLLGLLNQ